MLPGRKDEDRLRMRKLGLWREHTPGQQHRGPVTFFPRGCWGGWGGGGTRKKVPLPTKTFGEGPERGRSAWAVRNLKYRYLAGTQGTPPAAAQERISSPWPATAPRRCILAAKIPDCDDGGTANLAMPDGLFFSLRSGIKDVVCRSSTTQLGPNHCSLARRG